MSVAVDLVAGTVGGAAAVLIEHPFDTVKVLLQAGKYDGYVACARGILTHEGVTGFYRGMSARLVASSFEHAVVFASYKYSIRAVGGDEDRPTFWQVCVGGVGSGVASMLSLTPFELVKCKLQADDTGAAAAASAARRPPALMLRDGSAPVGAMANRQYSSSWACATQIYQQKGLRGLYKGGIATLYREVPGTAAWCGTYDFLKRAMTPPDENPKNLPLWKLMLAGGCAGVAFWMAMFPADVVKTRMQVDPTFDGLSFGQALRLQFRQHGVKGLYRGFCLTAARSFPSNAVIFMCFDFVSRTLQQPDTQDRQLLT